MPKRGSKRVKRRTHKEETKSEQAPKSFIIKRGPVGKESNNLITDFKKNIFSTHLHKIGVQTME